MERPNWGPIILGIARLQEYQPKTTLSFFSPLCVSKYEHMFSLTSKWFGTIGLMFGFFRTSKMSKKGFLKTSLEPFFEF